MRSIAPLLSVLIILGFNMSCKEKGCTDPLALNYNPDAKKEDNSCEYATVCTGALVDDAKLDCSSQLFFTAETSWDSSGSERVVTTNHIPDHFVGKFPNDFNPNSIREVDETLSVTKFPSMASSVTNVANSNGPAYAFGIDLNGILYDPAAAEAWEYNGQKDWDWTLEATANQLGLDCNNAHVQPNGEYHYHGTPVEYFDERGIDPHNMNLVGWAADGYPIYYKYAYGDANNSTSTVIAMTSGYKLKDGGRGGDGISEPCDEHNGVYVQDYEYEAGLGDLDECNGRSGVTPEFPGGTYYYVITDEFPGIPRCFKGTPSQDFKVGP